MMFYKIAHLVCTALLFCICITHTGCEKWRDNRETVTCGDHTVAEASFNDILRTALLITSPTGGLITDSCYSLTWSGVSYPRTVIVDYRPTYCEGLFGPPTTGSLSILISDTFFIEGATVTVSINDLTIDEFSVQGEMIITNLGNNTSGNKEFSLVVNNGVITTGKDKIISWECNYTYELIEINVVDIVVDDLYRITGSAQGVNQEGRDFQANIKEVLLKELDCRWMRSGTVEVLPSDLKDRELDYGDSRCPQNSNCCDNVAEVTINGRKEFTLRMK